MRGISRNEWPAAHHKALAAHLAAGLSLNECAAEINAEFGTRYTRNATIGRANRTGLTSQFSNGRTPGRHKSNGRKAAPKPVAKPRTTPAQRPDVAIRKARMEGRTPPPQPFVPAQDHTQPRRVSLLELTDTTCRWPIGDTRDPDFCYCGNQIEGGSPYCPGHTLMNRKQPEPRRS